MVDIIGDSEKDIERKKFNRLSEDFETIIKGFSKINKINEKMIRTHLAHYLMQSFIKNDNISNESFKETLLKMMAVYLDSKSNLETEKLNSEWEDFNEKLEKTDGT
jgi:hypothetical protein